MVRPSLRSPVRSAALTLTLAACGDEPGADPTGSADPSGPPTTAGSETETTGDPTTSSGPGSSPTTQTGCQDGAEQCLAFDQHQVCKFGTWTDDPCPAGQGCDDIADACLPCTCETGKTKGCVDVGSVATCTCFGYDPVPCEQGTACGELDDGAGCYPVVCTPGSFDCEDLHSVRVCNDSGTAWMAPVDCKDTELCDFGEESGEPGCKPACQVVEKNESSLGCDFWAVDMANVPPRNDFVFAVALSNPSETAWVHVEIFDRNDNGKEQLVEEGDIPPREVIPFPLSGTSNNQVGHYPTDAGVLDSALVEGRAFRIHSDLPIVATQFNPVGGAKAFTTDASLLLPTHTLSESYYHLAWEKGVGAGSALVVIATEDNTVVTINSTVNLPAKNGLPAITAGQDTVLPPLEKYDYVQLSSPTKDLTSTKITATAPVAVFGGHSCGQVPDTNTDFCDHLEEQIFPIATWGEHYVAARSPARAEEPMMWRIIAAKDGTIVEFDPPVSLGDSYALDAGEMIQFSADGDFELNSDDPVLVAGYMYGCKATGLVDCPGDPSMVLMVPVEQWLTDYVFLVDLSYTNDNVKLVREKGKPVSLGCLGPVSEWQPVSDAYESAVVNINPGEGNCQPGTNTATGASPFSIMVVGEAGSTSYAYPGGLQLKPINPG